MSSPRSRFVPPAPAEQRSVVLLGMEPMDQLHRARQVRIHHMHQALNELTPTTLLTGARTPRRWLLLRYLLRGGLARTRAVYVEASTSTATETDLLFLNLARRAGLPILVFIPDAYQLFPQVYRRAGLKVVLLDWGWRRSIRAYQRLADVLFFPSEGLQAHFDCPRRAEPLPPAGVAGRPFVPPDPENRQVVYVGALNQLYGADLLLGAMERVIEALPDARLLVITREPGALDGLAAPWLRVEQRATDELAEVMAASSVAVIPWRQNEYHDLAMPVKLFDTMSYGRPLVVTPNRAMAAVVERWQAGLVVQAEAQALADGLLRLLSEPALAAELGHNAYQAVQSENAWLHRAQRVLQLVAEVKCA